MATLTNIKGISGDLLGSGTDVRIITRGVSMFPLINTGDRITVSPERNPTMGDLIVFTSNDQMVCHRLVRVFEKDGMKYYQTRGDSLFSPDEPVTLNQILGKVVRIERERLSLQRRILLLIYPALKFWGGNAFVVNAMVKLRAMFNSINKQ
ncbi:MAG TPA: hypothetical protein DDX85_12560 [Nitrospiraceae bacterium]|nr:hypothetical protein [Nitrospiraceae bacterium]